MHGSLNKNTSDAAFNVYQSNNLKHNVLSDARETTVMYNVPFLEDPNKTKTVKLN